MGGARARIEYSKSAHAKMYILHVLSRARKGTVDGEMAEKKSVEFLLTKTCVIESEEARYVEEILTLSAKGSLCSVLFPFSSYPLE